MYNNPLSRIAPTALLLCLTSSIGLASAQENSPPSKSDELQFWAEGQVRLREEIHRGLFTPTASDGTVNFDLAHLRSGAALYFQKGDVSAVVEMQDVRWLGQTGTVADSEGLDLRRGALTVHNIANSAQTTLEAGRMVLAYGDQRLIGHLEWVNQARTFDGVRLHLVPEGMVRNLWADAFVTVTRETGPAHDDQYFGGIYTGFKTASGWSSEVYVLGLVDRMEAPSESGSEGKTQYATLGTRQAFYKDGIDAALETAVQYGTLRDDDFLAYGAALRASYTVAHDLKPRFGLEFVLGSGDGDGTDGDAATFQNLFPTNHLHYGYADQAGWSNLLAARATAAIVPHKKLALSLDYHHLRLTDAAGGWFNAAGAQVRAGDANASSHLGDEMDFVLNYQWRQGLGLQAGYAVFVPGGFVADTGGGDSAHFGYLQIAASFQ